jgi:hypothetical protein
VVVAGEGIKADPDQIALVVAMSKPTTRHAQGICKGLLATKFIPSYAEYTEPPRAITKGYPEKQPANIT